MEGRVRKMFPGGNTSQGFYSYYRYILPDDANRIFIIKGGPGTGKSVFMKEIAREMRDLGYDIELHYCSSDFDSLDAVVIEDLKIALMDGTAPHIVDPKYPGAVDEIINLGEHWNVKELEKNREEIIECSKKVSGHFARAYKLLAAAKPVMDDIEEKYGGCMDFGRVNMAFEKWAKEIFDGWPVTAMPGRERHLFASAYTPGGYVDYSETQVEYTQRIYYVEGYPGTGKTRLLERFAESAKERGVSVECFHYPLKPHKLCTVVLKELGIAVTCSEKAKEKADRTVDLNLFLDAAKLEEVMEQVRRDMDIYERIINEAVSAILDAKKAHDMLEKYYEGNMDFEAIRRLKDKLLERILEYR